jgi:hypothetical protein
MLPVIQPAPLTSLKEPIDHPNWLFELKHDGFRGMLYVDRDRRPAIDYWITSVVAAMGRCRLTAIHT